MASVAEQISSHLEFLGYTVRTEGDTIWATHSARLNILIRPTTEGTLFTSFLQCTDQAKRDRGGYLDFINSMNRKSLVTCFYADADSDLAMSAFYVGDYDRASFGRFVGLWEHDTQERLLESRDVALRYLK